MGDGTTETSRGVRVLSYERVDAARAHFIRRAGIEAVELAHELSVSRATLFRVIRSQDQLLGDAIWSLSERTFELAGAEGNATGVERIVKTARRYNEYIVGFEPLRRFMHDEPITAVRVLFTPAAYVHLRSVETWKRFFVEIEAAGEMKLPFDPDDFAYVFIRIGESKLYSDLLPRAGAERRYRRARATRDASRGRLSGEVVVAGLR